jgi:hypothetical protein
VEQIRAFPEGSEELLLKTAVGAAFEVRPKQAVTACLRARLSRIGNFYLRAVSAVLHATGASAITA